jgi:hypothetical protein
MTGVCLYDSFVGLATLYFWLRSLSALNVVIRVGLQHTLFLQGTIVSS